MKTAIFKKPGLIAVEDHPKPTIQQPTDAVMRVVRACVCGSDLWYYRGDSEHGQDAIGHEAIGVVEEIGDDVTTMKPGDLVIVPFAFSDNTCPHCENGVQTACQNGGFFGAGEPGNGCQAEYVRIQQADGTAVVVPAGNYSDEQLASFLALTDVMGTGYHAAVAAGVKPGSTVAVVGDGAVGLAGVLSAKLLGATRIIAMSRHESRQKLATRWGATDIVASRGDDAVAEVMQLTDGIGVDAVLECVGSKDATETAFAIARPGAIVGRVGLPHEAPIDEVGTFFRNVGTRGGPAPVREYLPELLRATLAGEINPGEVFDYETDLDHIDEAYQVMNGRRAIKALIRVSEV